MATPIVPYIVARNSDYQYRKHLVLPGQKFAQNHALGHRQQSYRGYACYITSPSPCRYYIWLSSNLTTFNTLQQRTEAAVIMLFIVSGTTTILSAFYTKWNSYWVDMAEFFYSLIFFSIQGFLIISDRLLGLIELEANYAYLLALPFIALQACYVRTLVTWHISLEIPHKDNAAIKFIQDLFERLTTKGSGLLVEWVGLLTAHARECVKPGCECVSVVTSITEYSLEPIKQNVDAYLSAKDLPEMYKTGPFIRGAKLLLSELAMQYGRNDTLLVTLAEMHFYGFGNCYYALELLDMVASRRPSLILLQRIYNMRKVIDLALKRHNEKSTQRESERTTDAIRYLNYYNKFLDQADSITDLTIKFWSVLLSEKPSAQKLNQAGRILFQEKCRAVKTVNKITELTTYHIDFLIRHLLFTRFVLHDYIASEQVYNKLKQAAEAGSFLYKTHGFSLFRADATVMFLLARIHGNGSATTQQINAEVEQMLGYSKKELIGFSITNFMPPMIARRHEEFVHKFFQSMETTSLNTQHFRFIKDKEGHYVPCRSLMKVVPNLDNDLQMAMFLIWDPAIFVYTRYRKDEPCKKAGAVICDENYKVIGFSKEAIAILKLSTVGTQEIVRSLMLYDLFPNLATENYMNALEQKEGKVVIFNSKDFQLDFSEEDVENNRKIQSTLPVWARLITETHGKVMKTHTLIVSEVSPERWSYYFKNGPEGELEYKEVLHHLGRQIRTRRPTARAIQRHSENLGEFSPGGSVSSATSGSMASSNKTEEMAHKMRVFEGVKQTPASIKRLGVIIIAMLIVVNILIGILFNLMRCIRRQRILIDT
eukprot:TRINITY_DN120707_c0_g1_i1.p1 TRINITY_DN120707_c0_g1~~TRINITY_DN120707_c0_g1_i1.p1  ORF type:complete len:823 (-),score=42.99 TRINITY_DN120707_c0_g1_i1:1973-4441(-)